MASGPWVSPSTQPCSRGQEVHDRAYGIPPLAPLPPPVSHAPAAPDQDLPLNCPRCGVPLVYVTTQADGSRVQVCDVHGEINRPLCLAVQVPMGMQFGLSRALIARIKTLSPPDLARLTFDRHRAAPSRRRPSRTSLTVRQIEPRTVLASR
jgi:hypothetical protein